MTPLDIDFDTARLRPIFIGVAGPARAGKDTLIDSMVSAFPTVVTRDQWAGPLKRKVAMDFGLSWDDVDGRGFDREEPHPRLGGFTIREALQHIGMAYREIDEDYWVKALLRRWQDVRVPHPVVLVSGTRFANEAEACDVVWWVQRDGLPTLAGKAGNHASETSLHMGNCHAVIRNDGTPQDMLSQATDLLTSVLLWADRRV